MSIFITNHVYLPVEIESSGESMLSLIKELGINDWLSGPCAIFGKKQFRDGFEQPTTLSNPPKGFQVIYSSITADEFYFHKQAPTVLPPERPFDLNIVKSQPASYINHYQKYPEFLNAYKQFCIRDLLNKIEQITEFPTNVFIYFEGLNFSNENVKQYLLKHNYSNSSVLFSILKNPVTLEISDSYDEDNPITNSVISFSHITFQDSNAPNKMLNTELGELFKKHLGQSLNETASFS
jgi:hypothetical protein